MKLNKTSMAILSKVRPELQRVILRAAEISPMDFTVTSGLRTLAQQKVLVAQGKSRTLKSRHLTGEAVDLCTIIKGKPSWNLPDYKALNSIIQLASRDVGVAVEWGGEAFGPGFIDGPHWQLRRKK